MDEQAKEKAILQFLNTLVKAHQQYEDGDLSQGNLISATENFIDSVASLAPPQDEAVWLRDLVLAIRGELQAGSPVKNVIAWIDGQLGREVPRG